MQKDETRLESDNMNLFLDILRYPLSNYTPCRYMKNNHVLQKL